MIQIKLSDGFYAPIFALFIAVFSYTPPTFSTLPLKDYTIIEGQSISLILPDPIDYENALLLMSYNFPAFAHQSGNSLIISPLKKDKGTHKATIDLEGGFSVKQSFSFNINVV